MNIIGPETGLSRTNSQGEGGTMYVIDTIIRTSAMFYEGNGSIDRREQIVTNRRNAQELPCSEQCETQIMFLASSQKRTALKTKGEDMSSKVNMEGKEINKIIAGSGTEKI